MSITYVITKLKEQIAQTEKFLSDISDEMNKLDENSKAFEELDFEFNYTTGMLIAYRHSLRITELGE